MSSIVRRIARGPLGYGITPCEAPLIAFNPLTQGLETSPFITYQRATQAWYFGPDGLLKTAANNEFRIAHDPTTLIRLGSMHEGARTNNALQCRDFTNATWVKTNVTPTLNQTGIDGVANTASLLASTLANGTALQTFTAAATSRTFSIYIKRVSGSGGIDITQDNGTTWTPVTGLSSSVWTRATLVQSVLNPVFGLRIQASGDSIAVDFAQLEDATFASSPILTTTTSFTRNAEVLLHTFPPGYNAREGTLFGEAILNPAPGTGTGNQAIASIDDGTSNNRLQIRNIEASQSSSAISVDGGVVQANMPGSSNWTTATLGKLAFSYQRDRFFHAFGGNLVGSDFSGTVPSAPTRLTIGHGQSLSNWFGYIRRVAYWPYTMDAGSLVGLTA